MLRADLKLIPEAVQGPPRWHPALWPAALPAVTPTTRPVELRSRRVSWSSRCTTANRDRSVFTDPDRLDVTRAAASDLAFGAGGSLPRRPAGRVELQEAFRGLIGR